MSRGEHNPSHYCRHRCACIGYGHIKFPLHNCLRPSIKYCQPRTRAARPRMEGAGRRPRVPAIAAPTRRRVSSKSKARVRAHAIHAQNLGAARREQRAATQADPPVTLSFILRKQSQTSWLFCLRSRCGARHILGPNADGMNPNQCHNTAFASELASANGPIVASPWWQFVDGPTVAATTFYSGDGNPGNSIGWIGPA